MLPRVLEPEVMDSEREARDYDAMDHAEVNRVFVEDLLAVLGTAKAPDVWRILDAGTGTALIPIELLRTGLPAQVVAADAAVEMLRLGGRNVEEAGFGAMIELTYRDCKGLADADESFDVVMSNSIVHHIPWPQMVLAECWRVLRPGGVLFVRDLYRPTTIEEVERLVSAYAGAATSEQQQLFRQSFHAALTISEVGELLAALRIPREWVRMTSDRHWTIAGIKPASASTSANVAVSD
ncbi:MAG: class I SAM-dependent methyltransferase [Planctomycetaceae bacterium]|nr:class I SAM-dependent methyltransferase [Planctomycetaceae bacterium]